MNIPQLRKAIIPVIGSYSGVPVIMGDQEGDRPNGLHATFKITSPYIQGVGMAEEIPFEGDTSFQLKRTETFKVVISFSAYGKDQDESFDLAMKIHDWFAFYGSGVLEANNIVVSELTSVQNRDSFVIEDYERRNGFDVTLSLSREMFKDIDYFETVARLTE